MSKHFPFLQTIRARLALTLFVSFSLLAVFSSLIFMQASSEHQQEITQRMNADLAQHVVKEYLLFEKGEANLQAAKQTFEKLMVLGPNFEFYVLDASGKVLAYSTDPAKIKRQAVDTAVFSEFFQSKTINKPICGDDPRSTSGKKVFSVAPIYNDQQLSGYLYVILGSEIYDDIASMVKGSGIVQGALWSIFLGVTFSLLATLWFAGIITRPLRMLTSQVQAIRAEGFSSEGMKNEPAMNALCKWNDASSNEMHALGSSFKTLLEKLDEQYKNVITIDQLRKELLSHISHDLRTPLASLLGYLETWELNHKKVSAEESTGYIATAKLSAQKISKLVEQLFELAYLDSGNVQVNIEPFSIAELVQDTLQKFKILAAEKGLALEVEPKDSSIQVVGDIEKLERVLSNLIDNAIRHTGEGGRIVVRLSRSTRSVAVEVSDNGIGIPPEDLPHVFEPHFKAGNSVRGNTAHGGLGLAISKKLLDLHQASIQVKSRETEGTSFEFCLPAAGV
ncbi:Signal transduction histidine kinase [Alteromonadaceae bacterium Bs31]|nr:Signal transduction histidine kinase [Alteromonadaceae bacterium Bs31]